MTAALGERHLRTAQAVNNRVRMLLARMDAAAAEPLFRFALDVFESESSDRSDAAIALNGLGRAHGRAFPEIATVLRKMAPCLEAVREPAAHG